MWSSWILCGFRWLVSWLSHRVTLLISPFCRWENWGLEKENHLTQFTELARDITRIISVWLCPIKLSVMEYSVSVMIQKVATAHMWPKQSPPTLSSFSSRSLPISAHPILRTHSFFFKEHHPRRKFPLFMCRVLTVHGKHSLPNLQWFQMGRNGCLENQVKSRYFNANIIFSSWGIKSDFLNI